MNYAKVISCLAFALLCSSLFSQTQVSGGLFTNTTWTAANSPYLVTNDVVLFPGNTLTIEPGVEVRFHAGLSLEIRGSLVAVGTATDSIVFTSISTSPAASDWNAIDIRNNLGASIDLQYAVVKYSARGVDVECCNQGGPLQVQHSAFRHNDVALSDYSGSIWLFADRCLFEYNRIAADRADKQITNSIFRHNDRGVDMERATIIGCEFREHTDIAIRSSGTIQNCLIEDNTVGLSPHFTHYLELTNSYIKNNSIGMKIGTNINGMVFGNTFCGNEIYHIEKFGQPNIDLSGNCFCDTTPSVMSALIYDAYDNVSVGLVTYQPYSASCDTSVFTNVQEAGLRTRLTGYPNPAASNFKVAFELQGPESDTLELLDLQGKAVATYLKEDLPAGSHLMDMDRNDLPAGIYFLRLRTSEKADYFKLIFM